MGAFYDIWIGGSQGEPSFARIDNTDWVKTAYPNTAFWESRPQQKDRSISQRIDTGKYTLIVIGQFYEQVNIEALLNESISYVVNETAGFNDPAGNYIMILLDKVKNNTYFFTDRFGTYHAYYRSENGSKAISTYFLGLAKQCVKDLDWEGITGFLSMGYFPGDKTYLKKIKILLPASCYSFDRELNLTRSRRYWNWIYEPSELPIREHLANIDGVLRSSLTFASRDKQVAMPVSGGLDSRTLAGVVRSLPGIYKNVWSYSYGFTSRSPETRIAKQIADKCGFSFNSYVVPDYLFDEMDYIVDSVELFQYVDGTRQICMRDQLAQQADVVIGGHWGDVWFSDIGITSGKHTLIEAFRKKIVKKGSNILLDIFSEYADNTKEQLEADFIDYVNKYKDIKDDDFKFKIYKTDQWSFRWTLASIRAYRSAITPVLPFYDKNVVSALTQVPAGLHKDRHLQIEYIKQFYSSLAKVRWQEYNSNLYNYKWLNNRNVVYRGIKKLRNMLSSGKQIIRNADVFYLHPEGRKSLEAIFNDIKMKEIVPERKVEILLNNYYKDPSAANTYAVSMLHTFAQFASTVL